jgi:hypothetical protein
VKLEITRWGAELSIQPPHHYWVRAGVVINYLDFESGNAWLYEGLVRRDALRLGPVGLYVLRMPRK